VGLESIMRSSSAASNTLSSLARGSAADRFGNGDSILRRSLLRDSRVQLDPCQDDHVASEIQQIDRSMATPSNSMPLSFWIVPASRGSGI
jgi:hypothetical protein